MKNNMEGRLEKMQNQNTEIGMTDYIATFTGRHMIPTRPVSDDIDIRDIAHALSMICRGNGQLRVFFSVGQHCVLCAEEAHARGFSDRIVLACLLHDASEAYLSDVPRPFKKLLTQYHEWEAQLLHVIYTKFIGSDLTEEEEKILKRIDDDLLYYDLVDLLNEPQEQEPPVLHVEISREFVPFEVIEHRYLELFQRFSSVSC